MEKALAASISLDLKQITLEPSGSVNAVKLENWSVVLLRKLLHHGPEASRALIRETK
jgi:hypothetical protein